MTQWLTASPNDPVNLAFGTNTEIGRARHARGRTGSARAEPAEPAGDVRASLQFDVIRVRELFPDVTPVDLQTGLAETVACLQVPAQKA